MIIGALLFLCFVVRKVRKEIACVHVNNATQAIPSWIVHAGGGRFGTLLPLLVLDYHHIFARDRGAIA